MSCVNCEVSILLYMLQTNHDKLNRKFTPSSIKTSLLHGPIRTLINVFPPFLYAPLKVERNVLLVTSGSCRARYGETMQLAHSDRPRWCLTGDRWVTQETAGSHRRPLGLSVDRWVSPRLLGLNGDRWVSTVTDGSQRRPLGLIVDRFFHEKSRLFDDNTDWKLNPFVVFLRSHGVLAHQPLTFLLDRTMYKRAL